MLDSMPLYGPHQAPLSSETLQARTLEWVAMPSSRGSSQPRDWTHSLLFLWHWQAGSLPLAPTGKPYIPDWRLSVSVKLEVHCRRKIFQKISGQWGHCSGPFRLGNYLHLQGGWSHLKSIEKQWHILHSLWGWAHACDIANTGVWEVKK